MSSRTCSDWPRLMEIAPDLQFMHYSAAEAKLPSDALVHIPDVSLDELTICCDLEHHVYFAEHTDAHVAAALRDTHWYELAEWTTAGPGTASVA
jgi:hypothetical protein